MMERVCPVCDSVEWKSVYVSPSSRIMTGDQRICEGKLDKVVCEVCGTVSNTGEFTAEDIEALYGKEYELNTLGSEEHFFYTKDGPKARSQVFFEWINKSVPQEFESLLEIGCGEGNLLSRLNEVYPTKNIRGIDGSHKASELARQKGLDVKQQLVFGGESLPKSDVVMLINVIEHVENIPAVIETLKNSITENGTIIFCLPIQDYGGYDVFFKEHVWHFTSNQFESILERNGLSVFHRDANHPVNHGIGLFACKVSNGSHKSVSVEYTDTIVNNIRFWEDKFKVMESAQKDFAGKKIALFGAGEVATLYLTFTSLYESGISVCIDDTKEEGSLKHGIPIHGSEWLEENSIDILLLTVNSKYHNQIREKLSHLNLDIRSV